MPEGVHRRQFVNFSFFNLLPEWRRLPRTERDDHRFEFAEAIRKWNAPDTMKVLSYSLLGTRPDADLMLWGICYSITCLQEMASDLLRTRLAGYLKKPYSYLAMTRQSEYLIGDSERQQRLQGVERPGTSRYLFVYPLVRTRTWYMLPYEDRQRMMAEVVRLADEFPGMRAHVVYSFGLDDQDFVIAVESDDPGTYVERVMRLRETDASPFVQRDTPTFTCVQMPLEEALERLG